MYNELGLAFEDEINAQVITVNAAGFSDPAQGYGAFMPSAANPPSPPTNIRLVERSSGSITIQWDVPEDDGGARIDAYAVYYYSDSNDEVFTQTVLQLPDQEEPVTQAHLIDLENGSTYYIRVQAINYIGGSDIEIGYTEFKVGAVPDAVQNVRTRTSFDGLEVAATWGQPAYNGGFEVTGYKIHLYEPVQERWIDATSYCAESNGANTVSGTICTFDVEKDLLNESRRGAAVNAKVIAVNEIGESEPVEGNGANIPTVPDAVQEIALFDRASEQVTIHWINGLSNGHNAVNQYSIEIVETATDRRIDTVFLTSSTDTDAFTQRMFTANNLDNGKEYTFTIQAYNIAGPSEAASFTVVVGVEPAAPTQVKTERSSDATEVVISWNTAGRTGILTVTDCRVFVMNNDKEFIEATDDCQESRANVHSQESCTISMDVLGSEPYNLQQGSSVYAKVGSTNMIGNSRLSAEGNGAVYTQCANGAPDAPVKLQEMTDFRTQTSLKVTWEDGECDGNSAIESYTIVYSVKGSSSSD